MLQFMPVHTCIAATHTSTALQKHFSRLIIIHCLIFRWKTTQVTLVFKTAIPDAKKNSAVNMDTRTQQRHQFLPFSFESDESWNIECKLDVQYCVLRVRFPIHQVYDSCVWIIVKKLNSLKTSCKDDCGWITQLKQQISKRRYYLAAHRRFVNVLTSNSAFFIFAVLVVC